MPRSRLARALPDLLNLRPGDGLPLCILLAHSFLKGVARVFFETPANTIFLTKFTAGSLPAVYIGTAVVSLFFGLAYAKLEERVSPRALLTTTLIFLTVVTAMLYLLFQVSANRPLAMAAMIFKDVHFALIGMEFWALAGLLTDVRQAKRLFGLVTSGEILAAILSGFSIPWIVAKRNPSVLFLISSLATAASVFLLLYTFRLFRGRLQFSASEDAGEKPDSQPISDMFRDRYLAFFFGVSVLSFFAEYFVEYAFYGQAAAKFPNEARLASFFGVFYGLLGAGQMINSTLLAGPLLSRFGLTFGLMLLPLTNLSTVGLAALVGSWRTTAALFFFVLVAAKLLDEVGRYTIEMPVYQILYQVLPVSRRLRVQAVRESIVEPIGIGLCGLAIYCFHSLLGLSVLQVLYITLFVAALWAILSWHLRREYTVEISRALASRRVNAADLRLHDPSIQSVLIRNLQGRRPEQVISSLELLEQSGYTGINAATLQLLRHPQASIRRHALRRIERLHLTDALAPIEAMLGTEADPEVRRDALRAMCALGGAGLEKAKAQAQAHLSNSDPHVRTGALIGLLRYGGVDGMIACGPMIQELASANQAASRALAAEIVSETANVALEPLMLQLLEDRDAGVRRAAIAAAGKLRSSASLPLLIEAVAIPGLRSSAMIALLAFGPDVPPLLDRLMGDDRLDRATRIWMARICARLQVPEGSRLLEKRLDEPDFILRAGIVQALSSCPESLRSVDATRVGGLIGEEIGQASRILAALADLTEGRFELVRRALSGEIEVRRDRILRLLALLYTPELMNSARRHLRSHSSHGRATAIEVLDNVLPREIKSAIWPLIDEIPDAERLSRLRFRHPVAEMTAEARMHEIASSRPGLLSDWTRASVVYAALRDNGRDWAGLLRAAAGDREALVRDTARSRDNSNVLLLIEKVLVLKSVAIFSEVPETALVDVAHRLEEVRVQRGDCIFRKGDAGTSLYIVVAGSVRVHDGDRLLAKLGEGDVFGEMAVLDPEPRMASVTATEEALLLRMDGTALEDLMTEHGEVARGIVRMLCQRLRTAGAAAEQFQN